MISSCGHRVVSRRLADVDHLDVGVELVEQGTRRQPVDDDDVGLGQQLAAAGGDEPGVAGPAADERDLDPPLGTAAAQRQRAVSSAVCTASRSRAARRGSPPP